MGKGERVKREVERGVGSKIEKVVDREVGKSTN